MPTLMVSISGIRGIIGNGLGPDEIVKFTSAFAEFCGKGKIIVGRDARSTGLALNNIVKGVLNLKGNDVIDIGICPTPTVLLNIKKYNAVGGIAISASHNPNEWNALKLMNKDGEFMTPEENTLMLNILNSSQNKYVEWNKVGKTFIDNKALQTHISKVLEIPFLDLKKLKKRKFRVLLDCVNGAGVYIMPQLLESLGCEVIKFNCETSGIFPRKPEPVPENLTETFAKVKQSNADLGIVVDPDVDRLVLITEKGEPFIEENTITQAVKFVTSKIKGNIVINLSTTRAVEDVAHENNCRVFRSPVGEANVVKLMKEQNAIIGGEGSGGVILPSANFGRDALVGTALTLQHLLEFEGKMSELKNALPCYEIVKNKIDIASSNPDKIINELIKKYKNEKINTDDGLRIDFTNHWVHLRKSNTEPIIRCITEAKTKSEAEKFASKYFNEIKLLL